MERYVRIGHTLNEAEKEHVSWRRHTVKQCLARNGIHCTLDNVPNIALIGSGGGQRAMVGLLASVLELKKQGLLDCMMYLSGVSGSTWAMASLYKETNWSSKLESVTKEIVSRLSRDSELSRLKNLDPKWVKYRWNNDNTNYTHRWSTHLVTMFVKEIDEHVLSEQRGKHDKDPYPIYTVIDNEFKDQKGSKDVWVEMTPHEAGYSLTGAFVDQRYFGSKFDNGKLIKEQPEMDMLYVQGLCGSALAGNVLATFIRGILLFTLHPLTLLTSYLMSSKWGLTYNFLHNMTAEEAREEDPNIQNQGLQGLSKSKTREYIDAGLLLNSPYFSVLRKERKVDLIISLDFSEGNPMQTIEDAHRMSKDMGIAFPHVEFPEDDRKKPKDFYVFPGYDLNTPTVIHMPLFNRVNCPGPDDLEQMREKYKTVQFPMNAAQIKELMERATANVSNTKSMLLEEIRKALWAKLQKWAICAMGVLHNM